MVSRDECPFGRPPRTHRSMCALHGRGHRCSRQLIPSAPVTTHRDGHCRIPLSASPPASRRTHHDQPRQPSPFLTRRCPHRCPRRGLPRPGRRHGHARPRAEALLVRPTQDPHRYRRLHRRRHDRLRTQRWWGLGELEHYHRHPALHPVDGQRARSSNRRPGLRSRTQPPAAGGGKGCREVGLRTELPREAERRRRRKRR